MAGETSAGPTRAMLAAAGLAVFLNGGLALLGDDAHGVDRPISAMFVPPGWLVGSVWLVLFALLGLARWRLLRAGSEAGREGARWTMLFIIVCALYPLYTLGLRSLTAGFFGNLGTVLLAIALGLKLRGIDRLSAGVFALVVGWLCYASLAVTAQLGWLPVWVTGH